LGRGANQKAVTKVCWNFKARRATVVRGDDGTVSISGNPKNYANNFNAKFQNGVHSSCWLAVPSDGRRILIKLKFILIKQASQMSHLRFNDRAEQMSQKWGVSAKTWP